MPPPHSDLPIITLDPPPSTRSSKAKYGGLYYLGIGGLVALVTLVTWFGWSLWALRDVLTNLYKLHDPAQSQAVRAHAAYALGHDPRVTQSQLWHGSLDKNLPELARYLLAESLTPDVMATNPKAYCEAVAYSPGWPDWLRAVSVRPLAYAAEEGITFPEAPLQALAKQPDRCVQLWACYVRAATLHPTDAEQALAAEANGKGSEQLLASHLQAAMRARNAERTYWLDLATRWMRFHHPQAKHFWEGWEERAGKLIETPNAKPRSGQVVPVTVGSGRGGS
jgi:hypothetical protein